MIAIVGMGLRLPGGIQAPETFWRALIGGEDCIGPLPAARQPDFPSTNQPYPEEAGYLNDVAGFDARFFGINGLEATYMDPQQRLLLETTWEAFEDAAVRPSQVAGKPVGVFVGAHACDYLEICTKLDAEIKAYWISGLNTSVLANRISHYFDFRGPSQTINTACSSGLEALHAAVNSLRQGTCDVAIAAAANLILSPATTVSAARSGILSPSARCHTFDRRADGFVRGEGVISFLLKPLDQARRDGDPIYACIRASVSRHQGRAQSLTAPSLRAQRDLLLDTYRLGKIEAESLGFIETHGTATPLGDSVEIEALKEAFNHLAPKASARSIGLGSVKTNIGHLEAAAGLAGLAKLCLAMQHRQLPANLHFTQQHPLIDLDGSPFQVQNEKSAWPNGETRRAGISSFGFGGTISHAILESSPRPAKNAEVPSGTLPFLFSGATEDALRENIANLCAYLELNETPLQDIAATLAMGREPLAHRWAVTADDKDSLLQKLTRYESGDADFGFHGHGKIKQRTKTTSLDVETICRNWANSGATPEVQEGNRTRLPTYAFQHNRYWIAGP